MLRGMTKHFRALPDSRMVPDPWIARPLLALDRAARGDVDHEEIWDEVITANGMIAAMLGSDDEIEQMLFGDDDQKPTFGAKPAAALAARVREELGEGFRIEVLRSGHPDWVRWVRTHPSRAAEIAESAAIRSIVRSQVAQPGRRQRRRPTKAQMRRRAEELPAEFDIPPEERRRAKEAELEDFEQRKLGVAEVLMTGRWEGDLRDEHGELWECTYANRLRLLGWEGEVDGETIEGPHRDEQGRLIQVAADQAYGPAPLGDAITAWLLSASEEIETMMMDWIEEDVAAPLSDTQPGAGGTSEA